MDKIAVFTATRAEYGLMRKLISNLDKNKNFKLFLLISSTHLDPKYGMTVKEIQNDGISSNYLLPISIHTNKKKDMANQTAETIKNLSEILEKINPDYFMILGDRYETFGAAVSAHILGIKIVHLHGGETTIGALDDKLRNAISQLSSFHFTSAEIHKKKVADIIGSTHNIYNVGPLVIDGILNLKCIGRKEFENKTGFVFSKRNFIVTFHSETLLTDFGINYLENLLAELQIYDCNILFTSPNADSGSDQIIKTIKEFISKNKLKSFYIESLGQELFLNALILFDCVIGNSSSGIIEAPLFKTNVINIGDRQKGRYRFGKVYDVVGSRKSIAEVLEKIFKNSNQDKYDLNELKKIYYGSSPSNQIIEILKKKNQFK